VNLEHIAGLHIVSGLERLPIFGDAAVLERFVRFTSPLRKTRYLHKFIQSHRVAFSGSFRPVRREEKSVWRRHLRPGEWA
jgi:hypothetical protein